MASLLQTTVTQYEGVRIIVLAGFLTDSSGVQLEIMVGKIIEKESLIFDLSNISLCTSGGLAYMVDISMQAKEHGNRAILMSPGEEIRRLAETANTYHLLIFAENQEECIVKLNYYT
jgi:anti-anti-sigma regulatory factor